MKVKRIIKTIPIVQMLLHAKLLYKYNGTTDSFFFFVLKNNRKISIYSTGRFFARKFANMMQKTDIIKNKNSAFFYAIDIWKGIGYKDKVYGNCTIDYSMIINNSIDDIRKKYLIGETKFVREAKEVLDVIEIYIRRLHSNPGVYKEFEIQIKAIESIIYRPSEHFFEAMQRILFINQLLWQTGHKLMGIGHLDWVLYDLYEADIRRGILTRENAKDLIKNFYLCLHEYYDFKSSVLKGDTGQIIILGGLENENTYKYNELTYLFLEVSNELALPDPKVLLRVSRKMPEDLLRKALKCMAGGTGAPLLSNDDVVIEKLLEFGYEKEDAYQYVTSACWEPLIPGVSMEPNNIKTFNFAIPLMKMLKNAEDMTENGWDGILQLYSQNLEEYAKEFIKDVNSRRYEKDPLLSIFSKSCLESGKDIAEGGAKYCNFGITSTGLGTVVDSLLNIKKYILEEKKYTYYEMRTALENDFSSNKEMQNVLKTNKVAYGSDSKEAVSLTNQIFHEVASLISKYTNYLGGKYKIGLSAPGYITEATHITATPDGRKSGVPFETHISGKNGTAPTEVISFGSKIDYGENCFNGNVVDLIMAPGLIKENQDKVLALLRQGIKQGFFQLQMNVIDSATLLEAQKNPELYPNLVVRVWGFSAYFSDLPKEYQDNLIRRALESEGLLAS